MTTSSKEIIKTSLITGGAGGIGMAIKNKFNLNNSPTALRIVCFKKFFIAPSITTNHVA